LPDSSALSEDAPAALTLPIEASLAATAVWSDIHRALDCFDVAKVAYFPFNLWLIGEEVIILCDYGIRKVVNAAIGEEGAPRLPTHISGASLEHHQQSVKPRLELIEAPALEGIRICLVRVIVQVGELEGIILLPPSVSVSD
jgi:hypothetical protein